MRLVDLGYRDSAYAYAYTDKLLVYHIICIYATRRYYCYVANLGGLKFLGNAAKTHITGFDEARRHRSWQSLDAPRKPLVWTLIILLLT